MTNENSKNYVLRADVTEHFNTKCHGMSWSEVAEMGLDECVC